MQSAGWDPNVKTRALTLEWVEAASAGDAEAMVKIDRNFGSRLEFGTAGLRGNMGPGTSCMNDLSVIQASQGLCAYLETIFGAEGLKRGVAIGYDHRARADLDIASENFALLTASVFLSRGFKVFLYPTMVATPLVPFAIETLGCVAGVMVTASHNPKEDNGYKVYWSNGSQIIPPHDKKIASSIADNLAPWHAYNAAAAREHENCVDGESEHGLGKRYIDTVAARLCKFHAENPDGVRIAYTAMHGVGRPWVERMFDAFNLPRPALVAAQSEPDPTFPTVALPNPEEGKGALTLAMQEADASGASIILANDPDADRLAVAEKDAASGEWHLFSGNDVGVLLGHWQWTQFEAANAMLPPDKQTPSSDVYMLAPAVASKMLASIADTHGFHFEETLTGFKWAGNRTDELRRDGKTVLFAYEPEIGFCVGDVVKDKDGVSAAAVFAEMAGCLAREGKSVADHYEQLKQRYGHFATLNNYLFCRDAEVRDKIFARLRNDGHYWLRCGRHRITGIRDLTVGVDSSTADGLPRLPVSAASQYLTLYFDNGGVVTLRTSGTEPKLKYYSELRGASRAQAEAELHDLVESVIQDMLQPELNGLEPPAE